MRSFFSGTDWENLEDRAKMSNYFCMLIVNKAGSYCAKVAFVSKREGGGEIKLNFLNNSDGISPLTLRGTEDKEILVVMDCKIVVEGSVDVDSVFEERWKKVVEAGKTTPYSSYKYSSYVPSSEQGKLPYKSYDNDTHEGFWELHKGEWIKRNAKGKIWDVDLQEWISEGEYLGSTKKEERTEKRISEMTEKEWNKSQTSSAATVQDVRRLFNYVLNEHGGTNNHYDPMGDLKRKDKRMHLYWEREKFVKDFIKSCALSYDKVFPNELGDGYLGLMYKAYDYLLPYRKIKIVKDILENVAEEIAYTNSAGMTGVI